MANGPILLIIFSQVMLYLFVMYMLHVLRKKLRERSSMSNSGLQEALIAREFAVDEHRIDVATREAQEETVCCRVCAFANAQRFRFCVLCGEKLQLLPSEKVRVRISLTARQERARSRTEWRRELDSHGQAFWHLSADGAPQTTRYPGYVALFQQEAPDDEDTPEVVIVTGGADTEPTVISKLQDEASALQVRFQAAKDADAFMFATGRILAGTTDAKGLLDMADEEFPIKFAHFVACTASLLVPAELEVLKLFLRRAYAVEESMEYLSCMEDADTRSVVRIDFAEETGVDAGGVHREWFMLVTEQLVNPALGLFSCANLEAQTFYINATSHQVLGAEHLAYFFAVGRLVGRALLEGEVLGFHFAPALLKIVLGVPVTFADFEDIDPVAYKGLIWLLEHDGADALGLDFTVTESGPTGEVRTVELVPNGSDVAVTDANKHEYVERRLRYFLLESVSSQLYALLKGLYQVIPRQFLLLFDASELDYVLCGCDTIDVTDWETNTKYSKQVAGSRVVRWFWELVRDMPNEYQRRLLQFATGCSRVPLGGFRHLTSHDGRICPFTLRRSQSAYIRSHACFNRLDLPKCSTRAELKEVLYATLDTEDQYGFTTA